MQVLSLKCMVNVDPTPKCKSTETELEALSAVGGRLVKVKPGTLG